MKQVVYISIYRYIYLYLYISISLYLYIYIYIYLYILIYISISIYLYLYFYIYYIYTILYIPYINLQAQRLRLFYLCVYACMRMHVCIGFTCTDIISIMYAPLRFYSPFLLGGDCEPRPEGARSQRLRQARVGRRRRVRPSVTGSGKKTAQVESFREIIAQRRR